MIKLLLLLSVTVTHQHQIFEDAGVAIEPTGYVYTYSTFVYEKIFFTVPNDTNNYHIKVCRTEQQKDLENQINKIYADSINIIQSRIDPFTSPIFTTKSKRYLPLMLPAFLTAAGVMNLGFSIYNTYQVDDLKSALRELNNENVRVKLVLNSTIEQMNKMIKDLNDIGTIIIPDIAQEINQIRKDQDCYAQMNIALSDFYYLITNTVINRVVSGIDNLYVNRITPDFLPLSKIKDTLLKRNDMVNSLYVEDTSLIYRLGSFIVNEISHNPFMVNGILILPKLLKEYIGTTISISKVPIFDNTKSVVVLDSPDFAIRDDNLQRIWCPNFDVCLKQASTFFCPLHDVRTNPSACFENLIYRHNHNNCTYKTYHDYPLVKQTSIGLLVSPTVQEIYEVQTDKDKNKKIKHKLINFNNSIFLTKDNGTEFIINKQIYHLDLQSINVFQQIKIQNFSISHVKTYEYQHIETLDKLEYLKQSNNNHHSILYTILIIFLLISASILIYYFRQILYIKRLNQNGLNNPNEKTDQIEIPVNPRQSQYTLNEHQSEL